VSPTPRIQGQIVFNDYLVEADELIKDLLGNIQ
jgi:hypothetical protein